MKNLLEVIVFSEKINCARNFVNFITVDQSKIDEFQPEDNVSTDDICLIILSSGTTGFPKGVMLVNRNIIFALSYLG